MKNMSVPENIIRFLISMIPFFGAGYFMEWMFNITISGWKQDIAFYFVIPILFGISNAIWPGKSQ